MVIQFSVLVISYRHLSNKLSREPALHVLAANQVLCTFVTIQYTVVGQNGVAGLHVLSPVELVPKNVLEPVPIPLHVMAGTLALETRGKSNRATSNHALVRNEFSPIISSLSDFFKIFFFC